MIRDELAEAAQFLRSHALPQLDLHRDEPERALDDQVDLGTAPCAVVIGIVADAALAQLATDLLDDHAFPGGAGLGMAEQGRHVGDAQRVVPKTAVAQVPLGMLDNTLGDIACERGQRTPEICALGDLEIVAHRRR